MTDLIIGSIYNLGWDKCWHWVNSINKSGYTGDKAVVIFGDDLDTSPLFVENGFKVYNARGLNSNDHICSIRFFAYYEILKDLNYNNIIATDVTDVIFQKNPSLFLNNLGDYGIVASSENIKYRDEDWGHQNVLNSFGVLAKQRIIDNTIYNAGVIAGKHQSMIDLFFAICMMVDQKVQQVPGGGGPDQAAYNILLSLDQFKNNTKFISHNEGWACQVGTTANPNYDKSRFNIDPNPMFVDGVAKTFDGKDYYIVHQYNRNSHWKKMIEEKYND